MKVYHCNEWHNEYTEFYMKYDVDDAIAELKQKLEEQESVIEELKADYKEACDRLQTTNLIKDEQIAATRHQKYKRCLALAKWCLTEKVYFRYRYDDWGDRGYDRPYKWKKVVFWSKWVRRWLKSAEQFKDKEAKLKSTIARCAGTNLQTNQPPSRAKENKMINAQENANVPMCKSIRDVPRTNSDVICELAIERREVSWRLEKLNKAIEADPEAVSAHHKELWHKQAKAMQEYVYVLGERIKDLIDNG